MGEETGLDTDVLGQIAWVDFRWYEWVVRDGVLQRVYD